jgi:ribosomal protein S18 acetylase RimI-like enzyme
MAAMNQGVLELVEIDAANWRQSLTVEVRPDQVALVADVQPVALVILAKCYLRPEGQTWTPYLALYRGEAVGVTGVASGSDRAYLRHFAIDHRRQGEGLGRLMLDEVVAAIRSSQPACRYVQVTTHPENTAALALYRSAGFRDTGDLAGIEPVLLLEIVPTGPDRQQAPHRPRTR